MSGSLATTVNNGFVETGVVSSIGAIFCGDITGAWFLMTVIVTKAVLVLFRLGSPRS